MYSNVKTVIVWLTILIIAAVIGYKFSQGDFVRPGDFVTPSRSDFSEGEKVDTNGNGVPDFIVKNNRFIGTVSGRDFGPATRENLKTQISPSVSTVKPSTVPPVANVLHPHYYSNFSNYIHYDINEFLSVKGLNITSNRSNELPEDIKNEVRRIGDYLHDHYTYGTYKSYNGLGEDDDTVFDCDDFAALMYRMGKQAGLDIYILDLPGHWANAIRYGNTLYTIEPQGYKVKYNRDSVKFGSLSITEYAMYADNIVVEK